MMRKLFIIWFLFLAFGAMAADKIKLTITITSLPVTGNNLSFSAPATKVITWSNLNSSAYVETNTTVNGCATNLFRQMAAHAPWTPRPGFSWANTNAFNIEADCGAALIVTNSGTWATLALDTNSCTPMRDVRVPIAGEKWSTSRVEIASLLVKGLNDYPTNTFDTNAAVLANFLSVGPHPQTVRGMKTFNQFGGTNKTTIYGGTNDQTRIQNASYLNGTSGSYTNLYLTNSVFDRPKSTNGINYGNAFSSPGPSYATGAEQFGSGALATNTSATAIGLNSLAGGNASLAVGHSAQATNESSVAIGPSAFAYGSGSTALGVEAQAYQSNSAAIGFGAVANHNESFAFGTAAETTTNNQFFIGGQIYLLQTSGRIQAGSITNGIYTGTNVNSGDWSDTPTTMTSLANGNNVVAPGNNRVIRLAAGPTASFSINSIQEGRNGRIIEIWNDTGQSMTIAHESGYDATNVNRIITSGADVALGTNAVAAFRYFTARNRWKLWWTRE